MLGRHRIAQWVPAVCGVVGVLLFEGVHSPRPSLAAASSAHRGSVVLPGIQR